MYIPTDIFVSLKTGGASNALQPRLPAMSTINYKDPSLLASISANGVMSSDDKNRLNALDGYASLSALAAEASRAQGVEHEIMVALDGYSGGGGGNVNLDGYATIDYVNSTLDGYTPVAYVDGYVASSLAPYATVAYVDGYACSNTDPRLSNSRTPTAHAPTHIAGGTDPIDGYHIPMAYTPINYTAPIDGYIGEHIANIDSKLGAAINIIPSDPRLYWGAGQLNTYVTDSIGVLLNEGSLVECDFRGYFMASVDVSRLVASGLAAGRWPTYDIYVDDVLVVDGAQLTSSTTAITYTASDSSWHRIKIMADGLCVYFGRWLKAPDVPYNTIVFTKFSALDIRACSQPVEMCLFFGDSITAGCLARNPTAQDVYPPTNSSVHMSYAYKLAAGAIDGIKRQCVIIAYGGQGYTVNAADSNVPNLLTAMRWKFDGVPRVTGTLMPNSVNITYVFDNSGVNDGNGSTDDAVTTASLQWYQQMRVMCPFARIIKIVPWTRIKEVPFINAFYYYAKSNPSDANTELMDLGAINLGTLHPDDAHHTIFANDIATEMPISKYQLGGFVTSLQDPGDLSTITQSELAVSALADKRNTQNYSQSTGANQPTLALGESNLAISSVAASAQYFSCAAAPYLNYAILVEVWRRDAATGGLEHASIDSFASIYLYGPGYASGHWFLGGNNGQVDSGKSLTVGTKYMLEVIGTAGANICSVKTNGGNRVDNTTITMPVTGISYLFAAAAGAGPCQATLFFRVTFSQEAYSLANSKQLSLIEMIIGRRQGITLEP